MKYCLSILTLIIALAWSGLCDDQDNTTCEYEIDTTIEKYCPQTTDISDMVFNYFNYRNNETSRDVFREAVDDYCNKIIPETDCIVTRLLNLLSDNCRASAYHDTIQVQTQFFNIHSEYFCANSRARYMDTIAEDGVDCLFNRDYAICLHENAPRTIEAFSSEHICGWLDHNINCEHHFSNCKNKHIMSYRAELFRILKTKFNC